MFDLIIKTKKMRTKKKILVVDDDIDIQSTLKTILKNQNYEVVAASGREEGLALAKQEHPDLAILDVMMETPREGFEMAREMGRDQQLSYLPVLMQTSVEVLTTSRSDMHAMVLEYRQTENASGLEVLLVKNQVSGEAAIDYINPEGNSIYFPVAGFLAKPVNPEKLLKEVERILAN